MITVRPAVAPYRDTRDRSVGSLRRSVSQQRVNWKPYSWYVPNPRQRL